MRLETSLINYLFGRHSLQPLTIMVLIGSIEKGDKTLSVKSLWRYFFEHSAYVETYGLIV